MGRDVESVFPLTLSAQSLERAPLDEVIETERGVLFVATPQPPRVGTRVQVDLTTPGVSEPVRIPAVVVWSRPPRPGVVAGFRAQIMNAPADLVDHIRDLASAARTRIERRESEQRRSTIDSPITERIRLREVTAPMRPSQPPPVREATGRIPPTPASQPVRETSGPISLDSLPPLPASVPPLRGPGPSMDSLLSNEGTPVRVTFTSARNYLLHFEQFLSHGRVYVNATALPVGSPVVLTIEVPDGDNPLVVKGIVERLAQPPEVPVAGWVARFADSDGTVGERLTTATFIAGTPTTPPPSRPSQ